VSFASKLLGSAITVSASSARRRAYEGITSNYFGTLSFEGGGTGAGTATWC